MLFGLVAQSVEQRTENPCVGGSIPPEATLKPHQTMGFFGLYVMCPMYINKKMCILRVGTEEVQ